MTATSLPAVQKYGQDLPYRERSDNGFFGVFHDYEGQHTVWERGCPRSSKDNQKLQAPPLFHEKLRDFFSQMQKGN